MLDLQTLKSAKHILLKANKESFANANALYSYVLTLQKRVSLYVDEQLPYSYVSLPWFIKAKRSLPSSADYTLEVSSDTLAYVVFCQEHDIKLNEKMATSLYAGLLMQYKNFTSRDVDGMVFATALSLIESKAAYKMMQDSFAYTESLASFRLRARLFGSMLLRKSATEAVLYLSDEDLKSSGAALEDAKNIMYEAMQIAHVKRVVLLKSDEEMRIITILEEK